VTASGCSNGAKCVARSTITKSAPGISAASAACSAGVVRRSYLPPRVSVGHRTSARLPNDARISNNASASGRHPARWLESYPSTFRFWGHRYSIRRSRPGRPPRDTDQTRHAQDARPPAGSQPLRWAIALRVLHSEAPAGRHAPLSRQSLSYFREGLASSDVGHDSVYPTSEAFNLVTPQPSIA
jgi:hypothetical protein